jgi:PleD family two-component response regulator
VSIVPHIIYADDQEDMRRMVHDVLAVFGHEVRTVSDGAAALAAVAEREPDLLILDRQMDPGLSGIEVCRAVKENPFTSHIPVLMLTALGSVDRKLEGYEAGADDYLAKPFDTRELRARVEALLRLVRRESDRNPTSGLPGGMAIESELKRRAAAGDTFAVCYVDLDNFKPFADTYGFAMADVVIRDTARALREATEAEGTDGDFVGHIGGDDFIVVTGEDRGESIARASAERFRGVIGRAVGEDALVTGTFAGVDRDGTTRDFPLAKLTAVVLLVDPDNWVSPTHLGEMAADAKRRARGQGAGTIHVQPV